uniref:type ISP restriction/modification enzyme n=1 Tax=Histophilus somni TaxID=731 RepID=UPI0012FF14BF
MQTNRQTDRQTDNIIICLTVTGNKGFSILISNEIPDLHLIGDAQCFPMWIYE